MGLEEIIKKIVEEGEREKEEIVREAREKVEKEKEKLEEEGKLLREKILKSFEERIKEECEKKKEECLREEERKTLALKGEIIEEVFQIALKEMEEDKEKFSEWLRKSFLTSLEEGEAEVYLPEEWRGIITQEWLKKEGKKVKLLTHQENYLLVKQGRTQIRISLSHLLNEQKERLKSLLLKVLFP